MKIADKIEKSSSNTIITSHKKYIKSTKIIGFASYVLMYEIACIIESMEK